MGSGGSGGNTGGRPPRLQPCRRACRIDSTSGRDGRGLLTGAHRNAVTPRRRDFSRRDGRKREKPRFPLRAAHFQWLSPPPPATTAGYEPEHESIPVSNGQREGGREGTRDRRKDRDGVTDSGSARIRSSGEIIGFRARINLSRGARENLKLRAAERVAPDAGGEGERRRLY